MGRSLGARCLGAAAVAAAAGLPGQQPPAGIGCAYAEAAANPCQRLGLSPEVAFEVLAPVIARVVEATNQRRLRALLAARAQEVGALASIDGELERAAPAERRDLMLLLDRHAYRPVWPRGPVSRDLERELFVYRHGRVAHPPALAPLTASGLLLWGDASAPNGCAPCADDDRALRAYAVLALAGTDRSGAVPLLLRALGEDVDRRRARTGAPGERQVVWLEVLRSWAQPRRGGAARPPARRGLEDDEIYVVGTRAQWQALADAAVQVRLAAVALQRWDEVRNGALCRFYDPLFADLGRVDRLADVALEVVEGRDGIGPWGPVESRHVPLLERLLRVVPEVGLVGDGAGRPVARVRRYDVGDGADAVVAFGLAPAR